MTDAMPAIIDDPGQMAPMPAQLTTPAIQRLELEARSMETAVRIANGLSKTAMVPEHFQRETRGKDGQPLGDIATYNLAAAILYGAELGLSAVQSAQNIFIVRGKPAVYSRTMAAQVRRAGYVIEEVEATNQRVVWKGERDGNWSFTEWDIGRAEQAGYTSNKLYQTNPKEMLRAKCIAELCRIKYQDVLLGMAYSVEELQLIDAGVTVQRVFAPGRKQGGGGVSALAERAAEAQEAHAHEQVSRPATPPAEQPPKEPEVEQVEPEVSGQASDEQVAEISSYYKRNKVAMKDALGDIGQMLQLNEPLKSLNDLSTKDADDILGMLGNG